jgi:hypothetical protein
MFEDARDQFDGRISPVLDLLFRAKLLFVAAKNSVA